MEFKKSRLEIDSHSVPGTSSSSPSPGINPGASGPYRGKYTRSSLGAASSSAGSRFSPYSVSRDRPVARRSVPVIRARRDDESKSGERDNLCVSGFGSTSSTAQRIMDTLASMSTPVMNAGRVRIDSIKSVRPLPMASSLFNSCGTLLSASSKFSGPPKTLSPLLLPKSPSGIRLDADKSSWSLKCLSIPPKMVDCGTNTEEMIPSPSNAVVEDKNNTSDETPKQRRSSTTYSLPVKGETRVKLADLIAKSGGFSNGDYKFDSAWNLKDINRYLGSNQHKKDLEKEESTSKSSSSSESENSIPKHTIPNGKHDRELGNSSPFKKQDTFGKSLFPPFSVPSTNSNMWECPCCMVSNKPTSSKCVCCATSNPDSKTANETTAMDMDKTDSIKSPTLSTAQWSCPTCMVPNKANASACVCCAEPNPNPVGKSPSSSFPAVSTSTTPTFKFGFASNSTSKSPTTTSSEVRLGVSQQKTQDSTTTEKPTGFSFGFKPTSTAASNVNTSSFGSNTNTTTAATSGFSFGVVPAASKPTSTFSSGGSFTFGVTPLEEEEGLRKKSNQTELWQCSVCPASNKLELFNCVTCGSTRPHEFDSNYKKPVENPKSETKFQPFFGAKSSAGTISSAPTASIFSTPSAVSSGMGAFSNSSSFSSGNPFGGGSGAFGSGSSSFTATTAGPFGPPSTTANTLSGSGGGGISFGTPPVSSVNSGSGVVQPFQFGVPSQSSEPSTKRKHDDSTTEGDPAKKSLSVSFNLPSAVPTLKLKEVIQPQQEAQTASTTPVAANPGGFLAALKSASDAVKASNEKQPSTVPQLGKSFDFGQNSTQNSGSAFGLASNATTTPFSFGSGNALSSTPVAPTMGQNPSSNPFPSLGGSTSTGAGAPQQFNLTPNFNFGASAPATASTFQFGATPTAPTSNSFSFPASNSTNPAAGNPALFQFSSSPSTGAGEGRKIKRATRRFNR